MACMSGERCMIESAPESENMMTYEEAVLYCSFCNYNGYTDWRMPTAAEYGKLKMTLCWYVTVQIPSNNVCWWVIPVRDV
jgi:hypothetical protein